MLWLDPGWPKAGIAAGSVLAWYALSHGFLPAGCWHCAGVAPAGIDTSSILVLPGLVLKLRWRGPSWRLY
jgi:hypothetical protein